ncbi:exported hypothetical protein [Candidatus Nitrospira nitrosa]|uniref:Uncharacterized protein n=1 Tax=Candidatus Nitrospira nitrosa TaxID=1742972 RepID=A0A0S4LP84_9BACT|nr:exported hypothetical protein [Candidatus Nitrospira nitrosa]
MPASHGILVVLSLAPSTLLWVEPEWNRRLDEAQGPEPLMGHESLWCDP